MNLDSIVYRQAFTQYLRKGTPIEVSIKTLLQKAAETSESHSTPLYRWHTSGDDRVRPSHAANEGKIFAWANPPATGHPSEEANCRCWAEPVEVDTTPLEVVALISGAGILRRIGVRVGSAIVRRIEREQDVPSAQKPDEPLSLPKPEGIPKHWESSPSNRGEGVRYRDPNNKHNEVRVQRGNPKNSNQAQRNDYVKWKKDGQWLDKYGKPVAGDSLEAHIPINEFKFNLETFK